MIDWEDLALQTSERFGGTLPHPDTASIIAAAYARAPHAVQRAIDRVALEYEAGGIRSPWGILKTRVAQIHVEAASTSTANDRERTIARAEQWLRNAGRHIPWHDVEDELFAPERLTAPLEYLIELEATTRERPGRPAYNELLMAAIERTGAHSPEPVPDSAGRLRAHDTPQLRAHFRELHGNLEAAP